MARRHDGPSLTATSREPKYRTSCDNCQAAKVKCGQGKPCRRCSVHMLQCIYSPSRRMGRPRTKRNSIVAHPPGRQSNVETSGNNTDGNTRSRPSTPAGSGECTASDPTTAVVVAGTEVAAMQVCSESESRLERWSGGESCAIPDELGQGSLPWSPLAHVPGDASEPAPSSVIEACGESRGQPVADSMALDGVSQCFEMDMPLFFQTIVAGGTASHPPVSAASGGENLFGSPNFIDLLLQLPAPTVANDDKDAAACPVEPLQSPQTRDLDQQQNFGLGSNMFPQLAAASPRQILRRESAMNQGLDDMLLDLASDPARGDRTLPRETCLSPSASSASHRNSHRHRGAGPLSPPDTATAARRRLSTFHALSGGSSLGERATTADEDGEAREDDDDGDEEEDEVDGEATACIIPSSASPPSDRPSRPSTSRNDPEPSISAAGGGGPGSRCGCVSALSRCIVSLRTAEQLHPHPRPSAPLPLDSALLLESEVAGVLARLERCRACRRESTMHLLALIGVRMMLQLLQGAVRDEFASRRRSSRREDAADDGRDPDVGDVGRGDGGGGGALWIGKYGVPSRARLRFLRRLLQARIYRLAVLVEERGKFVGGVSRDCFAGASSLLLADILQGLQTVMGLLELWNPKP